MRPPIKFKWYRNHHMYYGISLFLFGLYNYYLMKRSGELMKCKSIWQMCMLIGVVMALDDLVEHTITQDTPIRLLFEKFMLPRL